MEIKEKIKNLKDDSESHSPSGDSKLKIKEKIKKLKEDSGSHSPSVDSLLKIIGEDQIKVDACFLSNPYATDLFMRHMDEKLLSNRDKWLKVLEFYPPQNYQVAAKIGKVINLPAENIFVGNGAIEVIQALIHRYVKGKLCVILPTFSPYYEYVNSETELEYFTLRKEDNFELNIPELIEFCKEKNINNIVLINPNNPNGGYLSSDDIHLMLESFHLMDNVILDESFIHFAYEDLDLSQITLTSYVNKYSNLSIVKSMSKDFGVAGIRCGYGILAKEKVTDLLKNGYLWNISGLANFFFDLYADKSFQQEYELVRKKYIMNTLMFISELKQIEKNTSIKVYPSKSNFVLIELLNGKSSFELMTDLLVDYGVYVRECSDKKGLIGEFIRVASRGFEDNMLMIKALKKCLAK